MKRYNPGRLGGYPAPMFEAEDGAYVRYEDVAHLIISSARMDASAHPALAEQFHREPRYFEGGTEVWAIEDAGITHRYIATSEEEAREIHRGFQPFEPEEMWVVRRVL